MLINEVVMTSENLFFEFKNANYGF